MIQTLLVLMTFIGLTQVADGQGFFLQPEECASYADDINQCVNLYPVIQGDPENALNLFSQNASNLCSKQTDYLSLIKCVRDSMDKCLPRTFMNLFATDEAYGSAFTYFCQNIESFNFSCAIESGAESANCTIQYFQDVGMTFPTRGDGLDKWKDYLCKIQEGSSVCISENIKLKSCPSTLNIMKELNRFAAPPVCSNNTNGSIINNADKGLTQVADGQGLFLQPEECASYADDMNQCVNLYPVIQGDPENVLNILSQNASYLCSKQTDYLSLIKCVRDSMDKCLPRKFMNLFATDEAYGSAFTYLCQNIESFNFSCAIESGAESANCTIQYFQDVGMTFPTRGDGLDKWKDYLCKIQEGSSACISENIKLKSCPSTLNIMKELNRFAAPPVCSNNTNGSIINNADKDDARYVADKSQCPGYTNGINHCSDTYRVTRPLTNPLNFLHQGSSICKSNFSVYSQLLTCIFDVTNSCFSTNDFKSLSPTITSYKDGHGYFCQQVNSLNQACITSSVQELKSCVSEKSNSDGLSVPSASDGFSKWKTYKCKEQELNIKCYFDNSKLKTCPTTQEILLTIWIKTLPPACEGLRTILNGTNGVIANVLLIFSSMILAIITLK